MVEVLCDCSSSDRGRNNGGCRVRSSLSGNRSSSHSIGSGNRCRLAVGFGLLVARARDVASLATAVAGLAGSVEWAAVGSSALARDVTKLTTSVALHGLSLAIASEVVRATALVAAGSAATGETTTAASEATSEGSASTATNGLDGSSTRSRAAPLFLMSVSWVRNMDLQN